MVDNRGYIHTRPRLEHLGSVPKRADIHAYVAWTKCYGWESEFVFRYNQNISREIFQDIFRIYTYLFFFNVLHWIDPF